jgi:hypothetical protein
VQLQEQHPEGVLPGDRARKPEKATNGEQGKSVCRFGKGTKLTQGCQDLYSKRSLSLFGSVL